MTYTLRYIVPNETSNGLTRKLIFAPKGIEEGAPEYHHASQLAGPWGKTTQINRGTLDGAELTTSYELPVVYGVSKHGPRFALSGAKLELVDPVVTLVPGRLGGDGKPLRNLTAGTYVITTFALSAGRDEPALAAAKTTPSITEGDDEPALS